MQPTDPAQLEQGRWLFAQASHFVAGAATMKQIPPLNLPEVAFVGRSNVGKSSLINGVTGRNSLVRTSHTPGHTRQLNFFSIAERLMLVDLPGYGYAKASKKQVSGWSQLIYDYLRGRQQLKRVCLLIDSRRGVKPMDEEVMDVLDNDGLSYQVVLTKADQLSQAEIEKVKAQVEKLFSKHSAMYNSIMTTSVRKNVGIDELRAELALFMKPQ